MSQPQQFEVLVLGSGTAASSSLGIWRERGDEPPWWSAGIWRELSSSMTYRGI
jgi:hypothetical protein